VCSRGDAASYYCNFFRLRDIVETVVNPKCEIESAEETE
jgi:hypothetical protein